MANDYNINVAPIEVEEKAWNWKCVEFYLASFHYKPFGLRDIYITEKGSDPTKAVQAIISDIEYEIESLTELKDKIKSAYKL